MISFLHLNVFNVNRAAYFLLGILLVWASSSFAEDCELEVNTGGYVGGFFSVDSHTFSELEEVTDVVNINVDPATFGSFSLYSCPAGSYSFNDNILTTEARCRAVFTVVGIKKDCEPDEVDPVDDNIAQKPLFLTQSAPPNVMYILDDSGSMQFELMPDDIIYSSARYIYPRANGVYGGNDYDNYVPTVDDNNGFNARSRSPQINTVYYNPSKTYRPWVKADGSHYPDAKPSCALHNPERTTNSFDASRCRNLTTTNSNYNSNRWYSCNSSGSCSYTTNNKNYWPAKYFWYKGSGSTWNWDNFNEKEIRFTTLNYTGEGREFRDDCLARVLATCTYLEEIQNFANWYTYYRSRVLTARAGSGFAFATQGGGLRVGFGSINQGSTSVDGVNSSVIVNGVRTFDGANRANFFDALYGRTIPNSGTPLRKALDAAGKYFSRTDNKGPWGKTPGTNDNTEQLACRRNYTVLTTDGYWSGDSAGGDPAKNNDGTDNPTHSRPVGDSYSYKAKSPFSDNRSDTLADVAMYYWKTDLRSDMDNLVSQTKGNPAFWQHMVTFGVGIGVAGSVDPDTAFAAINNGASVSWPNPTSQELYKIDDLLHAGVNSRGGFFSASEPDVFANELSDVLQTIANESKSSASSVAANSTRLDSGTLVYQASFNSLEWSGRIQAFSLNSNGSLNNIIWDTNNNAIPAHGLRNVFTAVGNPGATTTSSVAFSVSQWDNLTANQKAALRNGDSEDIGKARINWLRGDQSKEGILFRQRSEILGDIINSDPFFVGATENFGYGKLSGAEGSSYLTFLNSKSSRTPMIYVGANDGMLHGFDAATGSEKVAFVPAGVYPRLASLSDPDYEHRYLVDGSPRGVDAYVNGNWKTVLVGATGAGGRSVFALDVTDPSSIGAGNLLWEFSTASNATHKLGVAMSQPTIIRVAASNKWVAIFGNGYASGDKLKLFVVDLATGTLLKAINTGVSGVDNGLATPVPVDINNDRISDYVYAGDLKGNLWKFDLTGATTGSWSVAYTDSSGIAKPLYKFVDASGNTQPVTSRPSVGVHPAGGNIIYVGTGKYFELNDAVVPASPQVQDFYGIRDNGSAFTGRDKLLTQTIEFEGTATTKDGSTTSNKIRVVSNNGTNSPPDYGWHLRLLPPTNTATGERVVSQPVLRNGRIIFATIIPSNNICGYGGSSFLMELDAINGGRITDPTLDTNNDGKVDYLDVVSINGNYLPISGIGTDEMIKTPGIIGAGELEYKYTSGSSGSIGVVTESAGAQGEAGRQSWRQLQ
ncbi:Tfp pilus assembly protein, tip-associated adhesin PilY1 [Spongiibacter sp. IMCC21906]|uniref:pilus assembly protein n=1 Tax=Spongiibacter sp. IMCC21906 TaxID=1620392 RepID=UPI00062DEF03|nr:PilC/PilY family type IV pilus protein [Spongiibacter sp. IMCC21906]AKH68974.1 Tfp pilus assembly protein, tip-associated adhesin PilY1 [Spongiibacter sp. IMCC21906]